MVQHHSLRVLAAWVGLACLFAASSPLAAEELFNKKNLEGWNYYLSEHNVGMQDVWSVREGLLVCKGTPMGYIYTAKPYKNFRLRVEYRWPAGQKPGNSGILMRINGKPLPLPRCLENQLQSGKAGDFYGFHGMKLSGDAARMREVKGHQLGGDLTGVGRMEGAEKEPGEWNTVEILLQGSTLKSWINGKLVNEATNVEIAEGPIGLQSEGGEIHFRQVSIEPLGE